MIILPKKEKELVDYEEVLKMTSIEQITELITKFNNEINDIKISSDPKLSMEILIIKECSNMEENISREIILETKEDVAESDFYIFLSAFRENLFEILFNKNMSFEEKLVKVLSKTEALCGEKIKIKNYKNSLELYKKTEPIDEIWIGCINDLVDKYENILKIEKEFQEKTNGEMLYSKILAYIIYRHFIKAVFDNSIKERICFAVESVRFIYLCDMKTYFEKGELTLKDRIESLKNWSKQIEYSDENTDFLIYGEL